MSYRSLRSNDSETCAECISVWQSGQRARHAKPEIDGRSTTARRRGEFARGESAKRQLPRQIHVKKFIVACYRPIRGRKCTHDARTRSNERH